MLQSLMPRIHERKGSLMNALDAEQFRIMERWMPTIRYTKRHWRTEMITAIGYQIDAEKKKLFDTAKMACSNRFDLAELLKEVKSGSKSNENKGVTTLVAMIKTLL